MSEEKFRAIGPTTYLCPVPAVILGCADPENGIRPNLITVAWTGVVCTKPPMLSVSIRKDRWSHTIISNTKEFTVNLISRELCKAMDFCGVKSGRDLDKFETLSLNAIHTPELQYAPAIEEAPAYLSCRVRSVTELGTHDLFLAEIMNVHIREDFLNTDGSVNEEAMHLVAYVHGKYHAIGKPLGFFGYSVASENALKRRGFPTDKRKKK